MDTVILLLSLTAIVISLFSLIVSIRAIKRVTSIIKILEAYPRVLDRLTKIIESKKKPRRRYIVFRIVAEKQVSRKELDRAIRSTVKDIMGVKGLADSSYMLVDYDEERGIGIIRSNNKAYKILIGVLGLIRVIGEGRVLIVPLSTHGTIRKAREKIKSLTQH